MPLKALVVVLSSIAQLLATVWNCSAHFSAKWRSSVFMHVSVNDFTTCFVAAKSFSFFFFSASYSSWIFVIIVCLRGALMLESPVATRKTSVNALSSTILIGLQLFEIHSATVLVNFAQADLMRGLRCLVRVVWRIPLLTPLADQRMHRVEVVHIAAVKR